MVSQYCFVSTIIKFCTVCFESCSIQYNYNIDYIIINFIQNLIHDADTKRMLFYNVTILFCIGLLWLLSLVHVDSAAVDYWPLKGALPEL